LTDDDLGGKTVVSEWLETAPIRGRSGGLATMVLVACVYA